MTKQDQILEAAKELFMQFGLKKVTVEEICREAGVSKMTFYKYFSNKHEMIKTLWDKWADEGIRELRENIESDKPFVDKIQTILEHKEKNSRKIKREFILDYINASPEMAPIYHQIYTRAMEEFMSFYIRSQEEGYIYKNLKPALFLKITSLLPELVKDDELMKHYPNYQDFVMEVNHFLYYGMLTYKARKQSDE